MPIDLILIVPFVHFLLFIRAMHVLKHSYKLSADEIRKQLQRTEALYNTLWMSALGSVVVHEVVRRVTSGHVPS